MHPTIVEMLVRTRQQEITRSGRGVPRDRAERRAHRLPFGRRNTTQH